MAKYKHILVAIDLTQEVDTVLAQAIELGKQNNSTLSLVNVVEHTASVYDAELGFPETPNIEQQLNAKATESLKKVKEKYNITNAKSYIRSGSAKREIIDLAKELDADMIVVGSHGRHGLQLLLGSTANGVLHLASCDVLAVRIN